MTKLYFIKSKEDQARFAREIYSSPFTRPYRVDLSIYKETRTNEQNRLMWAMLSDISKQVIWYGERLSSDNWKDVFSASLKKQKAVPGVDGGFVVLGSRTSKFNIAMMGDMIDLMYAFGNERGVKWTDEK